MSKSITVVICTCDRLSLLLQALKSIDKQSLSRDRFDVMVIDTTNTRMDVSLVGDEVGYLHRPSWGLSQARNQALSVCDTPYIAFMDDDAEAHHEWLAELIQSFDAFGSRAGCVGGPVEPVWEGERPAWLLDELLGYISVIDWGEETKALPDDAWLAGTNIAYRTALLAQIGGFRTDLGRQGGVLLSNEELETQDRIRELGYDVVYNPSVRVHHLVHKNRLSQSWFRKRIFWQAVSDCIRNEKGYVREGAMASCLLMSDSGTDPIDVLTENSSDPGVLVQQCEAIYELVAAIGRHRSD